MHYLDMVEPTKKFIRNAHIGRLIVVATALTTKSKIYESSLTSFVGEYLGIESRDLARQIEFNEGESAISETVASFFKLYDMTQPSSLLLSCTHYPLVKHVFEWHRGNLPIEIIDPSDFVAQELELLVDDTGGSGSVIIYMTKKSETMEKLVRELGIESYTVTSI